MRLFRPRSDAPSTSEPQGALGYVPTGVQVAGAWAWRILAVAAALGLLFWLISMFSFIVIPLMIAILIASMLVPAVDWLVRRRVPRGLAVASMLLTTIAIITALFWVAIAQIRAGYSQLQDRALSSWREFRLWLLESPLQITDEDINAYLGDLLSVLQSDLSSVFSQVISVGSSVGLFVTGLLLALFASIFVLYDGKRIWRWVVGLLPVRARPPVDKSGRLGWATLGNFVRVQMLVAAVDAAGIGLGMWILSFFVGDIPLIVPVAILVFLGSFIPVIGAVLTGALATLIVLIVAGFWPAVIMLGIVLLVQQVESHVLQPLIMGSAVKIHPLAVVFAVSGGTIVAGLAGAVLAVPTVAFLNVFIKALATRSWRSVPAEGIPKILSERQAEKQRQETRPASGSVETS